MPLPSMNKFQRVQNWHMFTHYKEYMVSLVRDLIRKKARCPLRELNPRPSRVAGCMQRDLVVAFLEIWGEPYLHPRLRLPKQQRLGLGYSTGPQVPAR